MRSSCFTCSRSHAVSLSLVGSVAVRSFPRKSVGSRASSRAVANKHNAPTHPRSLEFAKADRSQAQQGLPSPLVVPSPSALLRVTSWMTRRLLQARRQSDRQFVVIRQDTSESWKTQGGRVFLCCVELSSVVLSCVVLCWISIGRHCGFLVKFSAWQNHEKAGRGPGRSTKRVAGAGALSC